MKTPKNTPNEQSLLKALERLEKGSVPAQMKDANGGLATEGDDDELQVSASENASPKATKKSLKKGRKEEASDDEVSKAMDSPDEEHSPAATSSPDISPDDDDEEESSEPPAKKSVKKSHSCEKCGKKMTLCKCGTMKSIRKALNEDPEMKEFVDGSAFVEQLIEAVSDAVEGNTAAMNKALTEERVYRGRLTKAMVAIGGMLVGINQRVEALGTENKRLRKALANTPADERRTVLDASEVPEHPLEKGNKHSSGVMDDKTLLKAQEIIEELARVGKCPAYYVSEVEIHKSLDSLDPETIKTVKDRLSK